jgi:CheY-like chemotaxis protein
MKKNTIPCCYLPSTVIFIDDNQPFLESITADLPETVLYKTYQKAHEALGFLNEEYRPVVKLEKCLEHPEDQSADRPSLQVNVRAIHQIAEKAYRYEDVSVLVIDYAMPGLNGLEVCEELDNDRIKKILLTGKPIMILRCKLLIKA